MAYLKLHANEVNPSSPDEVFAIAEKYHLDFPNLPYLVDGEIKLTESLAIPRYIAFKEGNTEFFGKAGQDDARHQMVVGVLQDFNQALYEVFFSADYQNLFTSKLAFFNKKLKQLSDFLGDKKFFFGYLTYSDLLYYSYANGLRILANSLGKTETIENFKNLNTHNEDVAQLSGIKEFITNDPMNKLPFLPQSMVKFEIKN